MKQFLFDVKNNIKKPINTVCVGILGLVLILFTITMFFNLLEVTSTVSSSHITYQYQITYQWQTIYVNQCSYMYTFNGYQYVCNYVPQSQLVPISTLVPVWSYTSTFFKHDVKLYDLIISSFGLGIMQLTIVIPILLSLLTGALLMFTSKKSLREIGFASLGMLTVITSGCVISILRLFIVNTSSSSLGPGLWLTLMIFLLLLAVVVIRLIAYTRENKDFLGSSIVLGKRNISFLLRVCIFIVLLILSEVSISSLYGFLVYLLMFVGLFFTLKESAKYKIIGGICASGVLIYSMTSMIMLLVKALGKHSFLTIMPVDSIIFRLLDITVFVAIMFIIIHEIKNLRKNALAEEQVL